MGATLEAPDHERKSAKDQHRRQQVEDEDDVRIERESRPDPIQSRPDRHPDHRGPHAADGGFPQKLSYQVCRDPERHPRVQPTDRCGHSRPPDDEEREQESNLDQKVDSCQPSLDSA